MTNLGFVELDNEWNRKVWHEVAQRGKIDITETQQLPPPTAWARKRGRITTVILFDSLHQTISGVGTSVIAETDLATRGKLVWILDQARCVPIEDAELRRRTFAHAEEALLIWDQRSHKRGIEIALHRAWRDLYGLREPVRKRP